MDRIGKIRTTIKKLEEAGQELDKEKLINVLIVEHFVSHKTAKEEVEAVMNYNGE